MPIQITEKEIKGLSDRIDPHYTDRFLCVFRFLTNNPESALKLPGKNAPDFGTEEYFLKLATRFIGGRDPKGPKPPETVPDELVSFILHHYFDIPENKLEQIKVEHALSMGAENLVGELLERYVASVLEDKGWVWCSGAVTRSIDFIKESKGEWILLQIKNRDNSENSSSSAIRNNTSILKWHRTFSRKPATNWESFPDIEGCQLLSEKGFMEYTQSYLEALKGNSS